MSQASPPVNTPPTQGLNTAAERHIFRDRGHWAFIIIVVAGYVSALISPTLANDVPRLSILIGLGIIYSALGTIGFDYINHSRSLRSASVYFAVQLLLAASILYLSHASNFMILAVLPLVAHGIIRLPRAGAWALCLVILLMFGAIVAALANAQIAFQAMFSASAGMVFVAIFTQLTQQANQTRAEVERLAAELTQANHKLREYAAQIEELATTRERNRLAREIHDGLGHYLTVINMQIQAARAVFENDPSRAADALGKAGALTQEALADVRRSVAALRASPTDNRPLAESIQQLADECRTSGIQTDFTLHGSPRPLSPQAELTFYRAAQEALTNVRKHAHASAVNITLDYANPAAVTLSVQDNGIGNEQTQGGFGLLGVRERAQLLHGQVRLSPVKGQGFRLELEIPG